MSQIELIGFSYLSGGSMMALIQNVLYQTESNQNDSTIKFYREELVSFQTELSQAMGRSRKCEHTAELNRLDLFRGEVFVVMNKYLEAIHESYFIDPEKSKLAGELIATYSHLDSHIERLSFEAETTYLRIIITEFENRWDTAVACGVAPYVTVLKKCQDDLAICYSKKISDKSQTKSIRHTRQIVRDCGKTICSLVGYLNSMVTVSPDQFEESALCINNLFKEFSADIASEKTRRKHAVEKARAKAVSEESELEG